MRVLLIHNPKAGDDDHARDHLVQLATKAGHDVVYRRSKDPWQDDLLSFTGLVAVAGGDGTVAEVAKATARTGVPVTILPAGTANNIAAALGFSDVPHATLVAGWRRGTVQPFDLGVVSGPWGRRTFLESVGIGALADLMCDVDTGRSAYVNELDGRQERIDAALEVLQRIVGGAAGVRCELDIDGRAVTGDYLIAEVLNFGAAGPNLRLTPGSDGGDGRLDVALVGTGDREVLSQHLQEPASESRLDGLWQMHRASRVRVRFAAAALHIDDEWWRGTDERIEITVGIEPAALTFLVPGP